MLASSPLAAKAEEEADDAIEARRADLFPLPPCRWELTRADFERLRLTEEREVYLRGQIIEIATSFIGTPYFPKDSPFFEAHSTAKAKQFFKDHPDRLDNLDCCGLVRAVMWVLYERRDVAFKIRRFNQNYQRRALPMPESRLPFGDLSACKPGDLVFYAARPRSGAVGINSTQPIKHVEIMVGDGTGATLGSRWGDVVRRHDSYEFDSGRWEVISHDFRSIRNWLEGP